MPCSTFPHPLLVLLTLSFQFYSQSANICRKNARVQEGSKETFFTKTLGLTRVKPIEVLTLGLPRYTCKKKKNVRNGRSLQKSSNELAEAFLPLDIICNLKCKPNMSGQKKRSQKKRKENNYD